MQTDPLALGQMSVLEVDGAERRLGSIWRDQLTVVAWVRHFG